jgi:ribonucleoside-diphosphate reductase alpha chain
MLAFRAANEISETPLKAISEKVWKARYCAHSPDGHPIETEIEQSWSRVAQAIAIAEPQRLVWEGRYHDLLRDFRFLPGGRILASAGTDRRATLFNCFVMGAIADDLGSIFDHVRECALTLQQGGGVGYNFSTLRPRGALIRGQGASSSGPVSFMQVWNETCATVMSGGSRRGAMMGILSCIHPDIDEFVTAKTERGRLTNFNISVALTDAFMSAVRRDEIWPLSFEGRLFREVPARALWHRLMRAAYDAGEPGVIFLERMNERNNLYYCEEIVGTNPCGEVPLPNYGACLLGSLNLTSFVTSPFSPHVRFDEDRFIECTQRAVRFLDASIDVSRFPLLPQRAEALAKRRTGLGVTGVADALLMCNVRYDSDEAVELLQRWMSRFRDESYKASAALAAEKGVFPQYDRDKFLEGYNVRRLPADIRDRIARDGIRNGVLNSIAPAGSISLLANNVSSGVEPIFSADHVRRVRAPDGSFDSVEVTDYAVALYRDINNRRDGVPSAYVDASSIGVKAHVRMQSVAQAFTDGAVSKTVNVPADYDFADFERVYLDAYDAGCKGCTAYRPNQVRDSILHSTDDLGSHCTAETKSEDGPDCPVCT